METSRPVIVKRVPERLDKKHARAFGVEVSSLLQSDRPQIVFDLSQLRHIDAAGVEMLVQCLTTVMKHDGDIKLASLSPEAAIVLEFTRTARLFEIYETTTEAVSSYSGFLPNVVNRYYGPAVAKNPYPQQNRTGRDSTGDRKIGDAAA